MFENRKENRVSLNFLSKERWIIWEKVYFFPGTVFVSISLGKHTGVIGNDNLRSQMWANIPMER